MRGFAFQVDKLVSVVEDHQFLHELSLEAQAAVEELPSELDLSEASMVSLMSGVGPLPLDSISPDPLVESDVVQVPPDELVSGEIDVAPVPAASSTPVRPSTLSVSSVSRSNHSRCGSILWDYLPDYVSDSSCSSMDEEWSLNPEGSGKPVVVEPDSQTVESVAPPSSPATSPVDFTAAAASSSPGFVIRPQLIHPFNIEDPLQTPLCVPPSSPREAAESPASVEQDSPTGNSQVGHSPGLEGTESSTHTLSPVVVVISPATCSPTVSPGKHPGFLSRSSPPPPSSPERPVDQLAGAEKLAPAGPLSSGSGQRSHDIPAVSMVSTGSQRDSDPPLDQAKLLEDSFLRMQAGAESAPDAQAEEDGADQSRLDISLEGGVQVSMDCSVIERLRDEAVQEVVMWKEAVSRMMLNEHHNCSFPHVYGIRNHTEYFHHTEHPARMPFYDEFHDMLMRNDLTVDYIHSVHPFTVRYALARLLRVDAPLPEELLPEMEAVLKRHHEQIMDKIDRKMRSIQELDSRLNKLSESETIQVVEGSIVSPRRSSGSSPHPVELNLPVDSITIPGDVKTEELFRLLGLFLGPVFQF